MHTARLAVSMLVLLLVAGCSNTSSGNPMPADSVAGSSGNASTRPQELRLDDVNPCTLLSHDEYSDYHLDEPGKPEQDDRGADQCAWFGEIGYMDVTLVTFEGVEARKNRYGQMESTDPIDGFPAYTVTLPGDEEKACFVLVDVADGQHLDVQVGLYGSPGGIPPVCEYAHQFASSLMSTLVKS